MYTVCDVAHQHMMAFLTAHLLEHLYLSASDNKGIKVIKFISAPQVKMQYLHCLPMTKGSMG